MTLQFSNVDADLTDGIIRPVAATKVVETGNSTYQNGFKRALDLIFVVLALPIVIPVIGTVALLVALDGHNPFYCQNRIGRHGRVFRMWKLRSMVHNAEKMLELYLADNPQARDEWNRCQKLKQDPRITWIGRFIRKTSIDELPQIINVLNGTMSLVGPRPIMEQQRDSYNGSAYFQMTPGITGLWQVSDRNECEFIGRVYYDELYLKTRSFRTDVRIILRTVGVILRGTGY